MDVIKERQLMRLKRIRIIEKSIKIAKEKNLIIDENKIILACCSDWGITERMAKEYLKIAKFNLKFKLNNENKIESQYAQEYPGEFINESQKEQQKNI